jgi:hypothetical protein
MKLFLLALVCGFSLNAITTKTTLSKRIADKKTVFSKMRSDVLALQTKTNSASCGGDDCGGGRGTR